MTNRPKAIGTSAEVAVAAFLERAGMTDVRRIAQAGINDLGDVHYRNPHGRLVAVSVKGGKMAETASPEQIAKWLGEAASQAERAGAPRYYVVTKRAGVGTLRAELWRAHRVAIDGGIWSADLATMAALP